MKREPIRRYAILFSTAAVVLLIFIAIVANGVRFRASPYIFVGSAIVAIIFGAFFLAEFFYGRERRASAVLYQMRDVSEVVLIRNDDHSAEDALMQIDGAGEIDKLGASYLLVLRGKNLEMWTSELERGPRVVIAGNEIESVTAEPYSLQYFHVTGIGVTIARGFDSISWVMVPASIRLLGLFPLSLGSVVQLVAKINAGIRG